MDNSEIHKTNQKKGTNTHQLMKVSSISLNIPQEIYKMVTNVDFTLSHLSVNELSTLHTVIFHEIRCRNKTTTTECYTSQN